MVPPLVLAPKNTDRVLDLTAAPGSKTTQLSALMGNKGTIVANDEPEREIFIVNNLSRLGALNVMVTNRDAKVWPLKNEFDKVLLDAPCSALGSNLNAIRRFSIPGIDSIASVQKRMIVSAFDALKPGGILVYSTCTYAPQENEEVLAYLMAVREAARPEEIPLQIPHEHGLEGFEKAWRIYPQTLGSEGFFVAKISKAI
jgi:16S rRNA (cytosine1407-C5)-methyltransferase